MKCKSGIFEAILMGIIVLAYLLVFSASASSAEPKSLYSYTSHIANNSSPSSVMVLITSASPITFTIVDQNAGAPVNNPPVAAAINATSYESNPINIDVLDQCSDPDEDPLTIASVSTPSHGIATIEELDRQTIRYVPTLGYFGPDSFAYTISDGKATATANVTISCVSISAINNFIQGLPDEAFKPPSNPRKMAFSNWLNRIDKHIRDIQRKQDEDYQHPIDLLQKNIRAKADGSLGGNPKDDLITDSIAQEKICYMVDELIAALRNGIA